MGEGGRGGPSSTAVARSVDEMLGGSGSSLLSKMAA
jgi:hypothetical protein